MFNQHTKLEVSTIICNENMKGNAKCKNLSHTLGDLEVTERVDGKRIADRQKLNFTAKNSKIAFCATFWGI